MIRWFRLWKGHRSTDKSYPGDIRLPSPPRVHIDGEVWHLDVDSSHPGAVVGPKGWAVRRKAARRLEFGTSLRLRSLSGNAERKSALVREDQSGLTAVPVVLPKASLGSYVGRDKR